MKNLDYYVIEMIGKNRDLYLIQTVVALYNNGYFHWIDSDGQQCSLLPKNVNNLRKIEGIHNEYKPKE